MKNRNYLSPDFLALFENRVRSEGVWCDSSVNDKLRHKFVAKNPNSMLAISRCGVQIKRIEQLHENVLSQKCLVCELFDTGRKEVNNNALTEIASHFESDNPNPNTDKE